MDTKELYLSGKSIVEISDETGTPRSTIRFRLKRLGILRSRKEGILIASSKGRLSKNKGKKRFFTDEHCKKISEGKIKRANIDAKGFSLKPSGYIEITRGINKGRLQHIVFIEQYLGRRLFAFECVHHINGIRSDNRIENLEVMTRKEHNRLHAIKNNERRKRDKKGRYNNERCM